MRQHSYNKQHRYLPIGVCIVALGYTTQSLAAQCEFKVTNEWQSGYTAEVSVHNNTSTTIEGWEVGLEFSQGELITNAWRTQLNGNNPYQLENLSWNRHIHPNSTQSFGFNVQKTPGQAVVSPRLFGICDDNSDSDNDIIEVAITASNIQGTAPATISFSSQVTNSSSDSMSYLWDFGDGSRSSETNPQHVYQQPGTYSVSLTLSNATGSYAATPIEITISEAQPDSALCVFEVEEEWISGFRGKVTMTNTENVAIENWKVLMAFSDNTKLTGVWHGLHSGSNPYEITNENYNKIIHPGQSLDFGFNAQKAQENDSPTAPSLGGLCSPDGNINHPPSALASASVTSGEYPLTVNFDGNASYDLDEDPLTFTWDFGNGTKSNEPSPTYVFDKEGMFSVTLTVSDGVMNTVSEPILIKVTAPEAPPISEPLTLNPQSSQLYFVSTKKQHLVEAHTFKTLSGSISPDGVAQFSIDLNSVDTNNETRDGRMKEYLFDTQVYPQAEVLLNVDYAALIAMPIGSDETQSITATLTLSGVTKEITADIIIRRLTNKIILVQSLSPVLLNATDFGLESGIETLKTLASLSVISYAVPVSFNLVFEAQQ